MAPASHEAFFARIRELEARGDSHVEAFARASMEERAKWSLEKSQTHLSFLLFGSIRIASDIEFPALGISISGDAKRKDSGFPATIFWEGRATLRSPNVEGLLDAHERIERFIGLWHVAAWGGAVQYYSFFSHAKNGLGKFVDLTSDLGQIARLQENLQKHPDKVLRLILRAQWWFKKGSSALAGIQHPISIFEMYSAKWNAFECLIEAFLIIYLFPKRTKAERQKGVEEFFEQLQRPPTPEDVQRCYHSVVTTGLRTKATYVFVALFGRTYPQYVKEFFSERNPNSLYRIRNDINHANIEEHIFADWLRVEAGLNRLSLTVLNMLHLAGSIGVILNHDIQSCYTCRNLKDQECTIGRLPKNDRYWRFVCDGHLSNRQAS